MKWKSREIDVLCLGLLLCVTMGLGLHCGTTPPGLEISVEAHSAEAGARSERSETSVEVLPEPAIPEPSPDADFRDSISEQRPEANKDCGQDPRRGQSCQKKGCGVSGTWRCSPDKQSLVCKVTISKEVCDGKDNDCNGKVDEGVCPRPDEHWVHYFAHSGQNFLVAGLPKGGLFFLGGYELKGRKYTRSSVEFSKSGYVADLLFGTGLKVHQFIVGPSAWLYPAGLNGLSAVDESLIAEKDRLKWSISDSSAIKKGWWYDFRALQLMDNGELYATGTFKHPLTFGKVTLTPKSDQAYSTFVMRVDAKSGKILDSHVHLDNNHDLGYLVVDKEGRYALFAQQDEKGQYTFRGFNKKHQELWKRPAKEIMTVDAKGHFYTGEESKSGVHSWAKYTLDNKLLWKRTLLSAKFGFARIMGRTVLDKQGNLYMLFSFSGTIQIGKQRIVMSEKEFGIVVMKFDEKGNFLKLAWAKEVSYSPLPSLTIDGLGHVYVAAKMSGKTKNFFSEKPRVIFSEKPGIRLYAIWRIPASYWK